MKIPSLTIPNLDTSEIPPTTLVASGAVAVAVAALLALLAQKKKITHGPTGKPLRPIHVLDQHSWLTGDLVERVANAERSYDWFAEKMIKYNGEPWVIQLPGQDDMIMIATPEAVEDVTTRQFEVFDKGEFHLERIEDLFGAGLVSSDGARWFHQRKASVKFFSANVLRTAMLENIQTNMNEVCAAIDKTMAKAEELCDLRQLFQEFTLETFVEIGMGVDLNCIGSKDPHPFAKAVDVMSPIVLRRFGLPNLVWKTERWLSIGKEGELNQQKKILDAWLNDALQKSLQNARAAKANGTSRAIKSVVELFVEQSEDGAEGLQPSDLFGFMLTFVVAARDTTANTLSWLWYMLSKHPHVEEKIRTEMDAKLGGQDHAFLTTTQIKEFTYLEATLKEIIRLYPGAPFLVRQANKDTVICGETLVKKGQIVAMSAYAMARLPFVWGPDAAEFKPERWIDPTTGQLIQVPSTKFVSFSTGPRTCIGMNFAMLELRVVTANLLHKYKFAVDPGNDGSYEVASTMNMKHPLLAKATRIRK